MNILNLERSKKKKKAALQDFMYIQIRLRFWTNSQNFFITPHILCWTWRATDAL